MITDALPLRFVLTSEMYGEPSICCPLCEQSYVHLGQIVVEQAEHVTIVRNQTTEVLHDEHGAARGSSVVLTFACENGHAFAYSLRFHKGVTCCDLRQFDEQDFVSLWRD